MALGQNDDDLPSAPSAVVQPAPPSTKTRSPSPRPERLPGAQAPEESSASTATVPKDDTQSPPAKPEIYQQSGATIYSTVNEVSVVFTVTDRHNRYIKDLSRTDFRVLDDDRAVEDIRSFRRETDLPLQVGLLIDASNSIRERFRFEQESAIEFLNQTIRRKYDKAFVVGFDEKAELTQDFTDETDALAQGVRMLHPGGGTALYDALFYACRDKLLKSPQSVAVRRAIILVSDGEDNSSHVTREEAIEMALRANVIVYTISTNFPGGGSGDKVLERIAEATGGRAFEPFQLSDVANAFAQIQDDLRSQYELSYRPANFVHDGRYRKIAITALHKGLKVRSRSGYYAPVQ
ncbi:MAG: VWA domain-containing protein [Acidobacteria bacterium]|nr:VWA domain-containing protein [Acidobacteriota bacterium]MBV9624267.1 VWA domain-containing protein [Acidobacteriota bacterium]